MTAIYCKDRLFTNDCTAYTLYPGQANRIYNRLDLAHSQGIIAAPFGVMPPSDRVNWPIIMKPIINLYGMSRNYQVIPTEDAYKDALQDTTIAGQFWMPFIPGRHYTIDALMYKGVIIFYYALESVHHPVKSGIFRYHVYRPEYILPANIQAELIKHCLAEYRSPSILSPHEPEARARENLGERQCLVTGSTAQCLRYSGPLNIEIICPPAMPAVIIEAHLRWNGDNYLWKIKKNKPVLEHILITANGKAADLAKLAQSEPHRVPVLCAYMRNKVPMEYYYVPVFITSESCSVGISELKDQVWEFASGQGWPVIWDIVTGIHQPANSPVRLCICILKSGEEVARLETFKRQLGLY